MATFSIRYLVPFAPALIFLVSFACSAPDSYYQQCHESCDENPANPQPVGSICNALSMCVCPSGLQACCREGNPGKCQAETCAPEDRCPKLDGGAPDAQTDCNSDNECPQPGSPLCGRGSCIEGKCKLDIKVGPLSQQRYGDCKIRHCDVSGALIEEDDSSDYFDDNLPCTIDFCKDDVAENLAVADGTLCSVAGEGYCYQGKCVECIDAVPGASCSGGNACDGFWCEPFAPCNGGACGGVCAPCGSGAGCAEHADCVSNSCVGFMCQVPTCMDGRKNDGESDVDCGGTCEACSDGGECHAHADCVSQVCVLGKCQAPTCFDGIQNGTETGPDCGPACDAACL
jgi:hypothetical protein